MILSICLMANRFLGQCKDRVKILSKYTRIFLKTNATCKIDKECDRDKEASIIRKFRRAFDVRLDKNESLHVNIGALRCEYSICKKIPNKHIGLHMQPYFKIYRIKEHPAVCIKDDEISSQAFATVSTITIS